MSLFVIKLKRIAGKIIFVISIVLLIPFGYFTMQRIQNSRSGWNELGPLLQAIDKNKYDKVNKLIQSGYDVNEDRFYTYPSTPLTYAIDKSDIRIIQLLVENGADITAKPNNGITPLETAIFRRDTVILNYLLEQGILEKETKTPVYPLQYAISLSDWRDTTTLLASRNVVEALLKHGVDPNAYSDEDCTPLQKAIMYKNDKVVRLLLEYGAEMSFDQGSTDMEF
jgi:ankyrin repeat protein